MESEDSALLLPFYHASTTNAPNTRGKTQSHSAFVRVCYATVAGVPFTSLSQVLPFILIGIGVDDMVSSIKRSGGGHLGVLLGSAMAGGCFIPGTTYGRRHACATC